MATPPHSIFIGKHNTLAITREDVDITGYQYAAQVWDHPGASTALATYTCTVTSGGGGQVQCVLTSGETASLSEQDAVIGVEETATSGQPVYIAEIPAHIRYAAVT